MKLWIDDVRPAPEGYEWIKTVVGAKFQIQECERGYYYSHAEEWKVEIIDIDHDAGDYACYGGDYIKLLDWLEETGRNYPIHIHSMNPVGVENMKQICIRNGWKIV